MNGLFGFVHETRQKRSRHFPQVQLGSGLVTEFKQFDTEKVLASVGILFDEFIVFERHQDSMCRAAV
jgi:hypothetical protein